MYIFIDTVIISLSKQNKLCIMQAEHVLIRCRLENIFQINKKL